MGGNLSLIEPSDGGEVELGPCPSRRRGFWLLSPRVY